MSKKNINKQLILYGFHPHVSLLREFLGYIDEDFTNLEEDESQDDYLRKLDPADWRKTDHYTVLGLGKQRFRASDEDIRKAYRKRLLDHHPDKRRHRGEKVLNSNCDYFGCITKAFEILSDQGKRYAYDCVDEKVVDDSIPSLSEVKENFYCLADVFKRNARWSKKQPMPLLGNSSTPIHEVNKFYDEWEAYQSIRDYSYLDEEEKDKGEDRDHRRYIDRQNKQEREKRMNAEVKRIQRLVLLAFENDPRLEEAKLEVKRRRDEKKASKAKAASERREAMEKQRKLEEEILQKQEEEEKRKRLEELENQKKIRDAEKTLLKKGKKQLKSLVGDKWNYFQGDDKQMNYDHSLNVDVLCQLLSGLELSQLNERLDSARTVSEAKEIFEEKVKEHKKLNTEDNNDSKNGTKESQAKEDQVEADKWTQEAINCLVKAIKIFPPGTEKRWDVIATYLNQHLNFDGKDQFSTREALKKAKSLNEDGSSVRKVVNEQAFDQLKAHVEKVGDLTAKGRKIEAQITTAIEAEANRTWTVEEQKALESALRTVTPKTLQEGQDRWQIISDAVGTRTRKECMLRFKKLSEEVKAKKAALEASKNK